MTMQYQEAMDAIYSQFNSVWSASSILDPMPRIYFNGIDRSNPPNDNYWTLITTEGVREPQTSFGVVGTNRLRRFTAEGLVFVRIFCPLSSQNQASNAQAFRTGQKLAELAQSAFRAKRAEDVIFNNVRIVPRPNEEAAIRYDVIAEYEYDSLG